MDPFEKAEEETPRTQDPFAEAEAAKSDPFAAAEEPSTSDPFSHAEQALPGSSPQQPSGTGFSKRVENYSELGSAGLGAIQGITFDFADEIEAAVRSLAPGQTFDDALTKVRARYNAAQAANPKSYMAGQLGGALASSFVPGIGAINVGKGAGIAEVAAKGALQGGLSGFGAAEDKFSAKGARETAVGAAGGAVIGSAFHGIGTLAGKLLGKEGAAAEEAIASSVPKDTPKPLVDAVDEAYSSIPEGMSKTHKDYSTEVATKLYDGTADVYQSLTDPSLAAKNEFVPELKEFTNWVRGKSIESPISLDETQKALHDARMQLSPEDFTERYHLFSKVKLAQKMVDETFGVESATAKALRAGTNNFLDASYVFKDMDRRLGTSFEKVGLEGVTADNLAKLKTIELTKPAEEAVSKIENSQAVMDALEGKIPMSKLSPEDQASATKVRGVFDSVAAFLEEHDVPIQKIDNYVKIKLVQPAEAMYRIGKKVEAAGGLENIAREYQTYASTEGAKLSPELAELVKTVSYMTDSVPDTGRKFAQVLDSLTKVGGSEAYTKQRVASALFQRGEGMPEYLREKDLGRLMNASIVDATRYVFQKDVLLDMRYNRELANAQGATKDVEYIDKLINNVLGGTNGMAKFTQQATQSLQLIGLRKLEDASNPASKWFYRTLAYEPDKMNQVLSNVYANYLSTPKALVQNLASVVFQGIPEFGYTYGTKNLMGAFGSAVKNVLTDKGYLTRLEAEGITNAPHQFSELGKTVRKSDLTKFFDKSSNFILRPFEFSEKIGRATLYELSKKVVADKASPEAQAFFRTMSPSSQSYFNRLSGPEAEAFMNRYVQNRIMFSFNKMNQAQMARDAGPMLAMFTKYPTAVLGRALDRYRADGGTAGAIDSLKYFIVPFAAASAVNYGMGEAAPGLRDTLFGKKGVAGASPVDTLSGIAEGKPFKAPAVGLASDLVSGALSQDPRKLSHGVETVARGLVPGGLGGYYGLTEQALHLIGALDEHKTLMGNTKK